MTEECVQHFFYDSFVEMGTGEKRDVPEMNDALVSAAEVRAAEMLR